MGVAARPVALKGTPATGERSPRRMALGAGALAAGAAVLFALLAYVYTFSIDLRASRGAAITGDEPFYLLTTQSLLEDGDLDLRNQYAAGSYVVFFDHPDGLWRQSVPTSDGRLLSPHNPGLSVLLMPGFALGGLHGAQVELLLLSAATFALVFVLVAGLSGARGIAWASTLAVALSAPALVYATEVYPEVPAALALVIALMASTRPERPTTGRAIVVALALTAMMWLGTKYIPLVLLVAGYFLLRAGWSGRATLLSLGAIGGAAYGWFHLHTFGALTPYSVNVVYAGMSSLETVQSHIDVFGRAYRLWGLFIDERFGVGRWAPVLLLAVPGLVLLWRRRGTPRLVLLLIVTQVLMATFVAITMMGWWFPGRTVMTTLPLFALPLALLGHRLRGWGLALLTGLAVYSLGTTVELARAGRAGEVTMAIDPFAMPSLWFQATGGLFPNYTTWTAETWMLTLGWLAVAGVSVVLVWRHSP